jgi:hypothetical protein
MSRTVTRVQALEHVLTEPRRRAHLAHASSLGADGARAEAVTDEAVVAVFGRAIPGDLVMVDTLVHQEITRLLGGRRPLPAVSGPPAAAGDRSRTLGRRIRRRRAVRVARTAGAATLAVALTVGAAFGVGQIERTPVGGSPEGTDGPGPSASGTPGPQPLGEVTEHSLLPDAQPLLEGMLEQAGPGWSLAQFASEAIDADSLVYLVDPEGALYELPNSRGLGGSLHGWLPGTTLGILRTGAYVGEYAVVDLLTGRRLLTIHDELADDRPSYATVTFAQDGTTDLLVRWTRWMDEGGRQVVRTIRLGLDGEERATTGGHVEPAVGSLVELVVSPDGTRIAVNDVAGLSIVGSDDLAQVAAVASPHEGVACATSTWLTDDLLAVECATTSEGRLAGPTDELWLVPADGGDATLLGEVDYPRAWLVAGMTVVAAMDDEGTQMLYRARGGGSLSVLDATVPPVVTGSAGGRLFGFDPTYEGPYADSELVALDPFTGDRRVLLASDGEHSSIRNVLTISDAGRADITRW